MFYRSIGKRIFDLIIALALLIFFLPILFLVSVILVFHHKGNPFFLQLRPGKHGKIFTVIKFKTLIDLPDKKEAQDFSTIERLTKIGAFLRKFSIDEIPQLINVLIGDMSLVGPRPLLIEYLPLYNESQKMRHLVSPGITGWAQINGRNSISWDKKFELDLWYVKNYSFLLDIRILLTTLFKVITDYKRSTKEELTMKKFDGNA